MILDWYRYCLKHYFTFKGRASRFEYWSFTLINMAILFAFWMISSWVDAPTEVNADGIDETLPAHPTLALIFGSIYLVFCFAIFFPSLTVTVRRLHDRNHSGLWVFAQFIPILNFVVLIFLLLPSNSYSNYYGLRAPKSPEDDVPEVPPNIYGPYGDMIMKETQVPKAAPQNVTEGTTEMTQIEAAAGKAEKGSALDELMKEDLPNADTQAGVEVVEDKKESKTPNSETHRPMGAEESGLVSLLSKLSQK